MGVQNKNSDLFLPPSYACCQALRSAIQATAGLFVYQVKLLQWINKQKCQQVLCRQVCGRLVWLPRVVHLMSVIVLPVMPYGSGVEAGGSLAGERGAVIVYPKFLAVVKLSKNLLIVAKFLIFESLYIFILRYCITAGIKSQCVYMYCGIIILSVHTFASNLHVAILCYQFPLVAWCFFLFLQQFGASAFYTVLRWRTLYVRWTLSVLYIILSSWLSVCQKLSNLLEIWQSSDKNKLGHFWHTPFINVKWKVEHHLSALLILKKYLIGVRDNGTVCDVASLAEPLLSRLAELRKLDIAKRIKLASNVMTVAFVPGFGRRFTGNVLGTLDEKTVGKASTG